MQHSVSETSVGHSLVGIICLVVGVLMLPFNWLQAGLFISVAIALLA